jgi:hypothetical protein
MTLTVRLDDALEAALERYCAERGVTKSLVVQECLATYLSAGRAAAVAGGPAAAPRAPRISAAYRAFDAAGLVAAGELGGVSADKAAVRERARERVRRAAGA